MLKIGGASETSSPGVLKQVIKNRTSIPSLSLQSLLGFVWTPEARLCENACSTLLVEKLRLREGK